MVLWSIARSSKLRCAAQLVVLLLLFLTLAGCDSKGVAGRQFESARTLVLQGKFPAAIGELQSFLDEHPGHQLSSRATFLIAKSELGIGNLEQAQLWFERTQKQYPKTEEAHKAKFKLALIQLLRENNAKALEQFSALAAEANGPYTAEATALSRFLAARENQPDK